MSHHKAPVQSWMNEAYLEGILKTHFKDPDLKVLKMDLEPGSAEGDNYICQIWRIKLQIDTQQKNKHLSLIGKLMLGTKTAQVLGEDLDIFGIEAEAFGKLFPAINKDIKGLKGSKKFSPECYGVDYDHSLILMEDMSEKKFLLQPKHEFLNKKQALLVMEAYAALHGGSYKVVQKNPSLKKTFEHGMLGSKPNEAIDSWFANGMKVLEKNMDSYGLSKDCCRRLRGVCERLRKESLKVCDLNEGNLNIIRHGDCWKNNMLFHFTDGVPDDVILLDFQLMTYNGFAQDLHYVLFSSVDAEVLVHDLDEILEVYFDKLKAIAPEIPNLTLERIKKEFDDVMFVGCVFTLMFRALIYSTTPPNIEEMLEGQVTEMGFNEPGYIADLHKLLPLMEKAGAF